jgi:protein phosphatase
MLGGVMDTRMPETMHAAHQYEEDAATRPRGSAAPSIADEIENRPRDANAPEGELTVRIPTDALVVLVGSAGSGKSTWAARHFAPYQIVSSDACRAMVSDDPTDQSASRDAFRLLHQIVRERLKRGLLTVADSTALTPVARRELTDDAAEYGRPSVAIIFDLPPDLTHAWNAARDRSVPPAALAAHERQMRQTRDEIDREGFAHVYLLESPEVLEGARLIIGSTQPEDDQPPFDVVGDVHGCIVELRDLLERLGYVCGEHGYTHPLGRRAVFVGDLVDRGPGSVEVLELVLDMLDSGTALFIPGNHDNKLMRWLLGRPVRVAKYGLGVTIAQIESLAPERRDRLWQRAVPMLRRAPGYLVLDGGRLIVTHAGIADDMIGHWNRGIAEYCMYGDVEAIDAHGRPIRRDWGAVRAAGADAPLIVYGHTVVDELCWVNRTLDLDSGCVFGGQLTALRYPECELVSVTAHEAYSSRRAAEHEQSS